MGIKQCRMCNADMDIVDISRVRDNGNIDILGYNYFCKNIKCRHEFNARLKKTFEKVLSKPESKPAYNTFQKEEHKSSFHKKKFWSSRGR